MLSSSNFGTPSENSSQSTGSLDSTTNELFPESNLMASWETMILTLNSMLKFRSW